MRSLLCASAAALLLSVPPANAAPAEDFTGAPKVKATRTAQEMLFENIDTLRQGSEKYLIKQCDRRADGTFATDVVGYRIFLKDQFNMPVKIELKGVERETQAIYLQEIYRYFRHPGMEPQLVFRTVFLIYGEFAKQWDLNIPEQVEEAKKYMNIFAPHYNKDLLDEPSDCVDVDPAKLLRPPITASPGANTP